MGKRIFRIRPEHFSAQLPEWLGKKIQVLGKSGVTWAGVLESLEPGAIHLKDPMTYWYHFKKRRYAISFDDIHEIHCDKVSPW